MCFSHCADVFLGLGGRSCFTKCCSALVWERAARRLKDGKMTFKTLLSEKRA